MPPRPLTKVSHNSALPRSIDSVQNTSLCPLLQRVSNALNCPLQAALLLPHDKARTTIEIPQFKECVIESMTISNTPQEKRAQPPSLFLKLAQLLLCTRFQKRPRRTNLDASEWFATETNVCISQLMHSLQVRMRRNLGAAASQPPKQSLFVHAISFVVYTSAQTSASGTDVASVGGRRTAKAIRRCDTTSPFRVLLMWMSSDPFSRSTCHI